MGGMARCLTAVGTIYGLLVMQAPEPEPRIQVGGVKGTLKQSHIRAEAVEGTLMTCRVEQISAYSSMYVPSGTEKRLYDKVCDA
jgi:hypothetical protein